MKEWKRNSAQRKCSNRKTKRKVKAKQSKCLKKRKKKKSKDEEQLKRLTFGILC
jgi:hypothetical protein